MKQALDNILIQKANVKNRNGRIYTPDVLRCMLADIALGKRLYGTMGQTENTITVDLEKTSHEVRNMHVTDEGLFGNITILTTPMGKMLQILHDKEIPIAFALRAFIAPIGEDGIVKRCIFVSVDAVKETA